MRKCFQNEWKGAGENSGDTILCKVYICRLLWLVVGIKKRKDKDKSQISDLDNCVGDSINHWETSCRRISNKDSDLFDIFGLINLWDRLICQIICSILNLDRLLLLSQLLER